MSDLIELSDDEMNTLKLIADKDGITLREALSRAIHIFASKVDYTKNATKTPAA